jgi:2-oxoglutarate dehydrogenase complex dehydrogenase (E1) component-like enzyme
VLWEAPFGDFADGAHVVIDTSSPPARTRGANRVGWCNCSPTGTRGRAPEHSGARLERFLQLSAEDNWQIVVLSTPAQYFHALRRQALAR